MDLVDLGETLKARRKLLKLTQEAVAAPNGISRVTLSNLENGKLPELGVRKLMALCASLGLELTVREVNARPTLRQLVAERKP